MEKNDEMKNFSVDFCFIVQREMLKNQNARQMVFPPYKKHAQKNHHKSIVATSAKPGLRVQSPKKSRVIQMLR